MNCKSKSVPVVLVAMPFAPLESPSLALSALAASLRKDGIEVRCLYPGLRFAEIIGMQNYCNISNFGDLWLLGEWLFSNAAFPEFSPNNDSYLSSILQHYPNLHSNLLFKIREKATAYIDEVAQGIVSQNPRIVGCSSVFTQNCASLALLRRIRELSPEIVTVIGGTSCEGEMGVELHNRYQWVDYVFSGESDLIFPEFCRRLLSEDKETVSQGYKVSNSIRTPEDRSFPDTLLTTERVYDLTSLPYVDYDDYFIALENSSLKKEITPKLRIRMETSRGCWWGEISPCTFCGLNGDFKYRVKDAQRAYDEIIHVNRKYNVSYIQFVDACLSMGYFDTLLPMLSKESLLFFYEVRPNLTREQCKILSDAGVCVVLAGIENLHDDSLKLLNKGVTAFQSVRFLKWAYKYGIYVGWNYLMNIPGEKLEWYDEVSELIPLLTHLVPPSGRGPVRFDRYSRYYCEPESFGLQLKASPVYDTIYPFTNNNDDNSRIAYHFVDISSNETPCSSLSEAKKLIKLLAEWTSFFKKTRQESSESALNISYNERGALVIKDIRPAAVHSEYKLEGIEAKVYEICDDGATYEQLSKILCSTDFGFSEQQLSEAVKYLIENKLLVKLSGYYLSLAVSSPTLELDYILSNQ